MADEYLKSEDGWFFTDVAAPDFADNSFGNIIAPGSPETDVVYGNTIFDTSENEGWEPARITDPTVSETNDVVAAGFDMLNLNTFGFNGESLSILQAAGFDPSLAYPIILTTVLSYEDDLVILNNFSYSEGKLVSYDENVKLSGDVFRYSLTEIDVANSEPIGTDFDFVNFGITGQVDLTDVPNENIKDYNVTVVQIV